jgi:murein DD-endopeptidase MepM/ murein hydrolase activator NlpD
MVHPTQLQSPYAIPAKLARISIMRKGRMRSFSVRPWLAILGLGSFGLFMAAYIGATAYLICRDDLLGTAVSRQVAMQYAYEERIAALRSEIDRMASRNIVQATNVEERLALLLERQAQIAERQSELDAVVARAHASGIEVAELIPAPVSPAVQPEQSPALAYAPIAPAVDDIITGTLLAPAAGETGAGEMKLRGVLNDVESSIDATHEQQSAVLDILSAAAAGEAERLSSALEPIGVEITDREEPQGGPYIPTAGMHFVERAAVLRSILDDIERLRSQAAEMPLARPVASTTISSRFGYRTDPFLHRPGFHAGIDFIAAYGSEIRATGSGTVTFADWNGGYGKMIEIRHANGLVTRYGHLSVIFVKPGVKVRSGDVIGRVGSSGRSTGPHLHYETRRSGSAVNPSIYLAAGRALRGEAH